MRTTILNPGVKYFILFLFLFFSRESVSLGQTVVLSDSVVDFGRVIAGERAGFSLSLTNHRNTRVKITNVFFAESAFSTDLDTVQIAAGGQKTFHIFFEDEQNLNFTDFLQIDLKPTNRPLIVRAQAQAVFENAYYRSTRNKWGADLKAALHGIIKNHQQQSYSSLWTVLSNTDEDPDNPDHVLLIYSGWSYPKSKHGGDVDEWNREHVWAKSHGDFGKTPPAGTDVHHICPADVSVNSARGNLDFDNGGSLYVDGDGATGCRFVDGLSWEPRDAVKGDVARMLYYMVVRYEGDTQDGGYDLELTEQIPSAPNSEPLMGKKSTLYAWNLQDPVDNWEKRRNERVYSWQKNRNPFIDYPQLAERMPSISGIAVPVPKPQLVVAPQMMDFGSVAPGHEYDYFTALINTGSDTLNITQIRSSDPAFTIAATSDTVTAEKYHYLKVTFNAPQTEKTYHAALTIHSDDEDDSVVTIPMQATVSSAVSIGGQGKPAGNFFLSPNYPNPFNSSTTIVYHIKAIRETSQYTSTIAVELAVYNLLGRKVATLFYGRQISGTYSFKFNGRGLAGGVYFYRLRTENFIQTRKMILLQ